MMIAFSGIDGSGKTTQAQYIAEMLEHKGFQVCYVHMIQWTLVNRIGRFLQSNTEQNLDTNHRDHGISVFTPLQRLVALFDIFRFRIIFLPVHYMQKQIVICDRFFYDLGVQALYTGLLKRRGAFSYWELAPIPTVSILLDIPPEIAWKREGEHDLTYYQIKRDMYLKYAPLWRSFIVNAIEMETTRQQIIEIVCEHLGKGRGEFN
jgi:thymidylate kinase